MKMRVPIAYLLRMASKEEDQVPEEGLESHDAGRKPTPDGVKDVKYEASPKLKPPRGTPFGSKFNMTEYMREYRKRPENAQK